LFHDLSILIIISRFIAGLGFSTFPMVWGGC